ncbi:hypothetical protein Cri9333_0348 [Crinalium epipsammum PCC 9333]|uniref:Uncharacterized protein n=1 Tax=Crinalium epipsammum PCC 9333 TaxID=1173022 RepID=K9VUU3_9CYAN|nr:hypothetical protein [Crinalium epipsammum]AFZ11329.1 hypothetical protein Cri9333_0348 [Crinalium epipsammum PCC 9333]
MRPKDERFTRLLEHSYRTICLRQRSANALSFAEPQSNVEFDKSFQNLCEGRQTQEPQQPIYVVIDELDPRNNKMMDANAS